MSPQFELIGEEGEKRKEGAVEWSRRRRYVPARVSEEV
jgi:hypothetical protein